MRSAGNAVRERSWSAIITNSGPRDLREGPRSFGRIYAGLSVGMQETGRKLSDEAILRRPRSFRACALTAPSD